MLPIKQILVPVDWSEPSMRAFQFAASLAQQYHGQVVVLYVVPLATVIYGPAPEDYLQHMLDQLSCLKPDDAKIPIQYRLAEGDPATMILEAAKETKCDLIVIGTHCRTGLNRLVMGSVAAEVLRRAPCPVLTVKSELNRHASHDIQGPRDPS